MVIQSMQLDPDAVSYTDDQIVNKINTASNQITRVFSVTSAARPIDDGEVGDAELAGNIPNSKLAAGVAKLSLDSMADIDRGYVQTNPDIGEFKIVAIHRQADGKLDVEFDDVAV